MSESVFIHTQDQLKQYAQDVLRYAKEKGATDAAVDINEGCGLSISVRKGCVETIEQNKDKGMGVTVYLGKDGPNLIVLLGGGTKHRQQKDIDQAKVLFGHYKARKKNKRI